VSPVIAALLLVVIVVAAFTGVYMWILQQVETYRFFFSRSVFESRMSLRESGVIEFAWSNSSGVFVYVRNTGDVRLCVLDVFFNGTLVASNLKFCLAPGEGGVLRLNVPGAPVHGRVRLVTEWFNEVEAEVVEIEE